MSSLSSSGSEFQTTGLETENAWQPSVVRWRRGMSSWRRCAECSRWQPHIYYMDHTHCWWLTVVTHLSTWLIIRSDTVSWWCHVCRWQSLLLIEQNSLVVEIGEEMPSLVPGRVVFCGISVVVNDLRYRRVIDAIQSLEPFTELTVTSDHTHTPRTFMTVNTQTINNWSGLWDRTQDFKGDMQKYITKFMKSMYVSC